MAPVVWNTLASTPLPVAAQPPRTVLLFIHMNPCKHTNPAVRLGLSPQLGCFSLPPRLLARTSNCSPHASNMPHIHTHTHIHTHPLLCFLFRVLQIACILHPKNCRTCTPVSFSFSLSICGNPLHGNATHAANGFQSKTH